MMNRTMIGCAMGVWLGLLATAALAQGDGAVPESTISASGTARVQRPPALLRMHLQLTGRGKDLEEALAKSRERREAALAQLEKLGADKQSLKVASPTVVNAANAAQRRMEMMVAQRMGKKSKGAKAIKPTVTVTALLTAQWPLASGSPEKILLAAESIREKVKTADLAGAKEAGPVSPEEQEVAEEMAEEIAEAMRNSGEEAANPGQPHFVFVARITAADRQKALADAFGNAKTQGEELAKAAGVEIGPLVRLSGHGVGYKFANGTEPLGDYYPEGYQHPRPGMLPGFSSPEAAQDEAMAADPNTLNFEFQVAATFAIKK